MRPLTLVLVLGSVAPLGAACSSSSGSLFTGATSGAGAVTATSGAGASGGGGPGGSDAGGGSVGGGASSGDVMPAATTGAGGAGPVCDADQDGYASSEGTCAGDDCDDADASAHPTQTAFSVDPRKSGGFDFDCDGQEEQQTPVVQCSGLTGCNDEGAAGFGDDVACGEEGAFGHCAGVPCGFVKDSQKKQACR